MRLLLLCCVLTAVSAGAQPAGVPYTAKEIAGYRLTAPVFQRFDRASRLLAAAVQQNRQLAENPPFTREVALLEDVVVAATTLEARLRSEPALAGALDKGGIGPREYTTFALALFAARLAQGFVKSGVMRYVPEGVARDNVAFIDAHEREVSALLQTLGLEDP